MTGRQVFLQVLGVEMRLVIQEWMIFMGLVVGGPLFSYSIPHFCGSWLEDPGYCKYMLLSSWLSMSPIVVILKKSL